ncbi:4-hydroxy-tetrahydrodipicolinate synthase [Candidatus Bipolaricaulota bacterium]
MTNLKKFRGVFVPVVTIFNEDGSICETRTRRFIDYLIADCGVHGIFCPGSTGDYTLLSLDERRDLIRVAVEAAGGRVPVLAGSGHNATHIALELSQYAESIGADGVLVSLPHYPRPTQHGLHQHFLTLGKALAVPVMVYSYPAGMGLDIELETIVRLVNEGAIAGIKDSIDDTDHTVNIIREVGDRIAVFTGMDAKFLPVLVMGGIGLIGTAANVAPKHFVGIWDAYQRGDLEGARKLQSEVMPLCSLVTYEQAATKAALEAMGFPSGAHRLPITPAEPSTVEQVQDIVASLGLAGSLKGLV